MFLCSRAENSQHGSGVITEQRSFAVWRLAAIAFARRRSSVVSSERDDLHFDSASNDSAAINTYPTRRDCRKLHALPRTEKFSTFATRPFRGTAGAWSEACRWRHRWRRIRSFSVAALTAPGQKLLGGGGGTATPGQKLVGGGTDGAGSEALRWRH